MNNLAREQSPSVSAEKKIKVMLVDDSAVVRGLLTRWLLSEDNIEIVARCHNGLHAVKEVAEVKPDLIVLDIEMPEMDGLEALPLLIKAVPNTRVLIASTLSQRNAEISLTALAKGAHDYIPKPTTNSDLTTSTSFRSDLITKINALCIGRGGKSAYAVERAMPVAGSKDPETGRMAPATPRSNEQKTTAALPDVRIPAGSMSDTDIDPANLRSFNRVKPSILCIGSSTGGPRAVQTVLGTIASHISDIPVVLTQHMPSSFTSVFAGHLEKALPVPVYEAQDGQEVKPGCVYIAPGDRHMVFERQSTGLVAVLDNGPEVNFCKPAVDKMFMSAQQIFGNKTFGVILTGMGQDGAAGGKLIADGGGNVIVQDAASSIVWGMPGAAYKAGICAGVFSLDQIGTKISKVVREGLL